MRLRDVLFCAMNRQQFWAGLQDFGSMVLAAGVIVTLMEVCSW